MHKRTKAEESQKASGIDHGNALRDARAGAPKHNMRKHMDELNAMQNMMHSIQPPAQGVPYQPMPSGARGIPISLPSSSTLIKP